MSVRDARLLPGAPRRPAADHVVGPGGRFRIKTVCFDGCGNVCEVPGVLGDFETGSCTLTFGIVRPAAWHKTNAAANGKFPTGANPEERDYRYVHNDIVADAIAEILTKALPAYAVPTELRFDARDVLACDAEILTVGCDFSIGVFDFEMSMQFFTGGGTMIYPGCPIPEPRVTSAEISCEGSDDEGRSLAYEWTYDKPEWRAAANAPQWQRIDEFKKKLQDIWRDDAE